MPICPFPTSAKDLRPAATAPSTWLYLLERFEVGVVHIDRELRVIGMNEFARRALPVQDKLPFGKIVTSFHPEAAKAKLTLLLGQAECPVSEAPPVTMIINIPERVLLVKVSKIGDEARSTVGYTLVFYDITDEVAMKLEPGRAPETAGKRQLSKIPTVKQNRVLLVDVPSVAFIRSEGHYTWVHTAQGSQFCNLAISDIESRLDPQLFLRVHRSYLVNLSQVDEIVRDDGRMTLRMLCSAGTPPLEIPVSRSSAPRLMEHFGLADMAVIRS